MTILGLVLALTACGPVHRYPDGGGIEGQLEREVVALQLRVRELESQRPDADTALLPELVQIFSGSDVAVDQGPLGPRLSVPASALFADRHAPRPRVEATMVYDLLGMALGQHEAYDVLVVGHTSDRPAPAGQDHLLHGAALAHAFARHLIDVHGVAADRVTIASRGARQPIASNDLPAGQDENERIEVHLQRRSPTDG